MVSRDLQRRRTINLKNGMSNVMLQSSYEVFLHQRVCVNGSLGPSTSSVQKMGICEVAGKALPSSVN